MGARNRFGSGKRLHGFSLMELLVTIAVIVILTSLLLTGVARAQERVRMTVCKNNLRQISLASYMYAEDNNGNLPAFLRWLYTRKYDIKTGRLYPYLKTKGIYMCPTDKRGLSARKGANARIPIRTPRREYSYAMNCNICHTTALSGFREPDKTVVYLEAELEPVDYSGQIGPMPGNKALSMRHGKRGHLVMGDLSVREVTRKQFDVASRHPFFWLPNNNPPGPRTGPL